MPFIINDRVSLSNALALNPGKAKPAGTQGVVLEKDGLERYRVMFDDEPGATYLVNERAMVKVP